MPPPHLHWQAMVCISAYNYGADHFSRDSSSSMLLYLVGCVGEDVTTFKATISMAWSECTSSSLLLVVWLVPRVAANRTSPFTIRKPSSSPHRLWVRLHQPGNGTVVCIVCLLVDCGSWGIHSVRWEVSNFNLRWREKENAATNLKRLKADSACCVRMLCPLGWQHLLGPWPPCPIYPSYSAFRFGKETFESWSKITKKS